MGDIMHEMKTLLLGVALLVLVGIFGFFYRNIMERQKAPLPGIAACTLEAKICPDGTSVGRSGPSCTFAPCPPPNSEIAVGSSTIGFVLPAGYTENKAALGDPTLVVAYEKPSKTPNSPHAIVIRDYAIPAGKSANDIMIGESMHEPSGQNATSMHDFTPVVINNKTFYSFIAERFEGQVHSLYYLPRTNDVLRFEVLERDVDWTNPQLIVANLPEHQALLKMLGTLQAGN